MTSPRHLSKRILYGDNSDVLSSSEKERVSCFAAAACELVPCPSWPSRLLFPVSSLSDAATSAVLHAKDARSPLLEKISSHGEARLVSCLLDGLAVCNAKCDALTYPLSQLLALTPSPNWSISTALQELRAERPIDTTPNPPGRPPPPA